MHYPNSKKFKSRSLDSYGIPHEVLGNPIGEHVLATCCVGVYPLVKMLFYYLKVVPTATFVVVVG